MNSREASTDHYAGAAKGWAGGATLVYGPIASELIAMSPHPLRGRTVLDAGAGTGVASARLEAAGARPVATDLSWDMLSEGRTTRPPAVIADLYQLPVRPHSVDDGVASFVLNHLLRPEAGFAELTRVIRPGGALLATVYSVDSRSAVRDRVDQLAETEGWRVPAWYRELKADAVPLLGSAVSMRTAALEAGLIDVNVDERAVDVGVTRPEDLVAYRFGQAHFATWMNTMTDAEADAVRVRVAEGIRGVMEPYRPIVVFLAARTPSGART